MPRTDYVTPKEHDHECDEERRAKDPEAINASQLRSSSHASSKFYSQLVRMVRDSREDSKVHPLRCRRKLNKIKQHKNVTHEISSK